MHRFRIIIRYLSPIKKTSKVWLEVTQEKKTQELATHERMTQNSISHLFFLNKVLLKHNNVHSFRHCLPLPSFYNSRVAATETTQIGKLKIFTIQLFNVLEFANPYSKPERLSIPWNILGGRIQRPQGSPKYKMKKIEPC